MNLSPHFTLAEFIASGEASRRGISNDIPIELLANAKRTTEMLERIRAFLSERAGRDVPLLLSSGFRCIALNRAIGSKDDSDHPKALAADWTAPMFGRPTEIAKALAPHVDAPGIGQLINEYPSEWGGWVHTGVSIPSVAANRVITITAAGARAGITQEQA